MKKNFLIFSVLIAFIVAALGFDSTFKDIEEKYSGKNEEEIFDILFKMDIEDIFDEINYFSSLDIDDSALIYHAIVLSERTKEVSEERLVSTIIDDKTSLELKIILIDLYSDITQNQYSSPELEKLFLSEETDQTIKHKLIWDLKFEDDVALYDELVKLANGDNADLAFQAIKRLNSINKEYAVELSDSIISDYENQPTEKVRIAIKVKAMKLRGLDNEIETQAFIEFSNKILDVSKDELMRDTVIFALSTLNNEDALSTIVYREDIDEAIKCYCIEENYENLLSLLEKEPAPETIELAIRALNIYRIDELLQPLYKAMDNYQDLEFSKLLVLESNPLSDRRK